jgi:ABC-type multidrug transport system ATPase subunit
MTADKIVVISDGKVVEQGTHMDLLALKGHYHALVSAQQLNIADGMENEDEESEGQSYETYNMKCKRHCIVPWGAILYLHSDDCIPLLPKSPISFSSLWGFYNFIASMFPYSCYQSFSLLSSN